MMHFRTKKIGRLNKFNMSKICKKNRTKSMIIESSKFSDLEDSSFRLIAVIKYLMILSKSRIINNSNTINHTRFVSMQ